MSALAASHAEGFGGFVCAGRQLALPLEAVREVVPVGVLLGLPCDCADVVGARDLRGVLLPVLDLARQFGAHSDTPADQRVVVVVVHDGHVIGLLVDAVTGIFMAQPDSIHPVHVGDAGASLFAASLRRADQGSLVALLSPAALAAVPGLPWLKDPEPFRAHAAMTALSAAGAAHGTRLQQVLLVHSHGMLLAIPAMAVHATVSNPPIAPSPLAHGVCVGVTDFAGQRVPVVDLLALCGLGQTPLGSGLQSFLVRVGPGLVSLLVDQVVDVVNAELDACAPLPAMALPQPALFRGLLPADRLPEQLQALQPARAGHYLLLDDVALRSAPRLVAISAANAGGEDSAAQAAPADYFAVDGRKAGTRALMVFELNGPVAVPLEQIDEVLPCRASGLAMAGHDGLRTLTIHRGRSLPVLDLANLLGLASPDLGEDAAILLVAVHQQLIGFAVPRLHDIVMADWESHSPGEGVRPAETPAGQALARREVVMIGTGAEGRLLRVLDIRTLAAAVLGVPATAVPVAA